MKSPHTYPNSETVCTRFSRIGLDPDSVREFIDWLCGMDQMTILNHKTVPRDSVETAWGWNAPPQRLAKLLWQLVHRNRHETYFHQTFTYGAPIRTTGTEKILAPIQQRIRWVLEGAFERQKEDRQIGQGDWGECWWLPVEQTAYVRKQLSEVLGDEFVGCLVGDQGMFWNPERERLITHREQASDLVPSRLISMNVRQLQ